MSQNDFFSDIKTFLYEKMKTIPVMNMTLKLKTTQKCRQPLEYGRTKKEDDSKKEDEGDDYFEGEVTIQEVSTCSCGISCRFALFLSFALFL